MTGKSLDQNFHHRNFKSTTKPKPRHKPPSFLTSFPPLILRDFPWILSLIFRARKYPCFPIQNTLHTVWNVWFNDLPSQRTKSVYLIKADAPSGAQKPPEACASNQRDFCGEAPPNALQPTWAKIPVILRGGTISRDGAWATSIPGCGPASYKLPLWLLTNGNKEPDV